MYEFEPHHTFSRIRPAHFQLQSNQQGQVVLIREKKTLQDFYNGFATVGGFCVAWAIIGSLAYLALRTYILG